MRQTVQWLPFLSSAIVFAFAASVLHRYRRRRGLHLLLWGIGLLMYGIGTASEAFYTALGWNEVAFRLWYLFGAMLVAAWLGQGTVYLLARRRWAHVTMVILLLGSLYGAARVFTAQLDPTLMHPGELSGHAIITPGVRILTPFFNLYGTVTLVGGALYSAWLFWRKGVLPHRAIGNVLIAVGAMFPAMSGLLSRIGLGGYLYVGELVGAALMFAGFLRATTPMPERRPARSRSSAVR
ncbi:MAG: hypothetical protein Kow0047_28460 [Anaerolineae bacterium]